MSNPIKVGLVTLDTSHVIAFTKLLNDPSNPHHIPGAKVVAGFPGGSADIPLSKDRVQGYADELRTKNGVEILDSPEAVAKACDVLFLESIDGRVHLDQLRRTLPMRRPTFIDKPFATSYADAKEMFRLADAANVPLMSSSSLRYSDDLTAILQDDKMGAIVGCDAFGPMTIQAEPPGLFWYGIHAVEIIFAVMGAGWQKVQAVTTENADVVTITWKDGRLATLRGLRKAHSAFGVTVHREKGFQQANLGASPRPNYAAMLDVILKNLPMGKSPIPKEQTLEVIQLIEAANVSRATHVAVSCP